jgi:cytochrome P450
MHSVRTRTKWLLYLCATGFLLARSAEMIVTLRAGSEAQLLAFPLAVILPFALIVGLAQLPPTDSREGALMRLGTMIQLVAIIALLKLGPYRSWILFHPAPIEALLTDQWASFIRFRKLTDVVAQWNGDSLLLAEGEEWRERRRKVLPAFQTRRLGNYGAMAVRHATQFADRLDAQVGDENSVTFDTDAAMARLTLDIAVGALFGADPPENGSDVERALLILSDTAFRESTSPLSIPDWLPLPAKRRKRWAMGVMDRLVVGLVERALLRDGNDGGDLVSMLIEHHDRNALAIRNDAMSLLIAGHETSGALLSWIFACLSQNRDWLDRITDELKQVLDSRPPKIDDLSLLKTVRAVVEETLRLYPPAYSLFLRQATLGVDLAGTAVAKGDLVQVVPFTLHRDGRWFENPTMFDPRRFLDEPTWPRYAYLPFGAGPRVCIGQNFALMEVCLVVTTILQRWHPCRLDQLPALAPKFSLRPKNGMPMIWRRNT